MTSVIVFDTYEHEEIASAILAHRAALIAAGKVQFQNAPHQGIAVDPSEATFAAIERLSALRNGGHITQQEFDDKRAELLARL